MYKCGILGQRNRDMGIENTTFNCFSISYNAKKIAGLASRPLINSYILTNNFFLAKVINTFI